MSADIYANVRPHFSLLYPINLSVQSPPIDACTRSAEKKIIAKNLKLMKFEVFYEQINNV